ncbi:MAG: altronate dehydratase family protein [Eubacteriales bacterium]|nr:altronate dehydratase family protein [Eubacteriales bacterium]MDD3866217.1 altronate dehydratase family protein [Eubacteriales bacterium]
MSTTADPRLNEIVSLDQVDHCLIHDDDQVVVLLQDSPGGIPAGHKIARSDIRPGQPIRKYGEPIGVATRPIRSGQWVHTHNLISGLSERLDVPDLQTAHAPEIRSFPGLPQTFNGFVRNNGQVGVRNEIWVIPTVGCVNQTANLLAEYGRSCLNHIRQESPDSQIDTVTAWTHPWGCSQLGDDLNQTRQLLQSLTLHPNAGGVLVLGLGCENNQLDEFRDTLPPYDPQRVRFLQAQDVSDELAAGRDLIDQLIRTASEDRREACSFEHLTIGLKCGGSDGFSGLTANPLLGRVSEWLISQGGSALLTEVPEMFGADQVLLARTADHEVAKALAGLLQSYRDEYTRHGQPVDKNPSPGNQAGGLSTLEDKSLGCTQKAGRSLITDVLPYAGRRRRQGLSVVAGPGNDAIACTALAAAGAQIILFTTGRGTPLGGPVPTMKIASTDQLAQLKPHWIDFSAGSILGRNGADPEMDAAMIRQMIDVTNGRKAKNEQNGYREISLLKQGVIL